MPITTQQIKESFNVLVFNAVGNLLIFFSSVLGYLGYNGEER